MNDQNKYLIDKWKIFFSDLQLTSKQQLNYSRMFENISLYNRTDNKFLLSLGFHLLKQIKEIIVIPKKKSCERVLIINIEEEDLYDAGVIIVDFVMPLIKRVIKEIEKKMPLDFKISNIEVERSDNILSIYLVL